MTVIRDPQTRKFRMWYNHGIGKNAYIGYAESEDGIHWETPSLGIYGPDNRVWQIYGYDTNVIDEGSDFPRPQERFKLAWWGGVTPERLQEGLRLAVSPDGIHWTAYEHNPVLPTKVEGDPRVHMRVSDIADVFYDPIRKRYAGFFKASALASDGYIGGPRAGELYRRLVIMSVSDDFFHWRRPWRVMVPEPRDEGLQEFYSSCPPLVRGNLMISFVRMLHDEYPVEPGGEADGIGYTTLATSRDGVTWQRHDEIFFDRNPRPDNWDRAMTWIGSVLTVGNEHYLYYGGYKLGHKKEPKRWRQLGVAKMDRDRFVSRGASGETPAHILTIPFRVPLQTSWTLHLNAKADEGKIRVRICREDGTPLAGYDYADMQPVTGDGLSLPISWIQKENIVSNFVQIDSEIIRLDFEITNARLFGVEAVKNK